jgi:hypothetical protein
LFSSVPKTEHEITSSLLCFPLGLVKKKRALPF